MIMTFWQARVYRARDHFHPSYEDSHVQEVEIGGCKISLSLGRIPTRVIEAEAYVGSAMYRLRGFHGPAPAYIRPSWDDEMELYTTILVSRDIEMESIASGYLDDLDESHWYACHAAELGRSEFLRRTSAIFERAAGSLLGSLGPDIINAALGSSSVFVECAGGEPMPTAVSIAGPARLITSREMADLPQRPLDGILTRRALDSKILGAAGRWFTAALNEEDSIKKFLWAFAGLDALAAKSMKELRDDLVAGIFFQQECETSRVQGSAVRALLWPPATSDDIDKYKDPGRNLAFRFAAMSLVLSPGSASEDLKRLAVLSDFRNRIHGDDLLDYPTASKLAPEALDLLMKYASLVCARV